LPILSSERYGEVRFGAPLAAAEETLQQLAEPQTRAEGCSYVTFAAYPDIRFMIENEIVTRADTGATIANSTGLAIGDNSAELQQANPEIKIMPHKYDPGSHYLVLSSADGTSALVFEESGGLITQVRAGVEPSVEYVEGCG
jgi:hypothetical protein